jgi:hypothetical protein
MVFCPVIVVVMLESWVAKCVHCAEDVASNIPTQLSSITTTINKRENHWQ